MANYVYLFETRFTPGQRRALQAVQEAARQNGVTAFLVGGAVRDLAAGVPVRDLDFVIQGDASALLPAFEAAGARRVGEQSSMERFFLRFPGGVRAEVGSALSVHWPEPGKPEVERAPVLDDLRRRDFTVNAMAVSLNEGSYGLLMDPLNGTADLENRELRLVSAYGFIEEPSRLVRATRLSARLGFTLEERTQTRFENARADSAIERLGDWERRYELEELFHEEDPVFLAASFAEQGWDKALQLDWTPAAVDSAALDRLRELHGQLDAMGIHADIAASAFPLLTAKLPAARMTAMKASFARTGFADVIDELDERARELSTRLNAMASAAPSEVWKLIFASEPETVIRTAFNAKAGALQARFRQFLQEWPQSRQRIPYALMTEMRIQPTATGYDQLIEDLFFAIMDNQLATPEAMRAYLEPFAPPAPVSAPVRRRAAKATKSKARKTAAKTPAPVATPDTIAGEPQAAAETAPAPKPASKPTVAKTTPAKAVPAKAAAAPAVAEKPQQVKSLSAKTSAKAATPAKAAAAPAKSVPTKAPAKQPSVKASAAKKMAVKAAPKPAAKQAQAVKAVAKKVAAKTVPAKKAAPVKAQAPAKKVVAKKTTPPAKKAAAKVAAKAAAKPAKTAARR